MPTKELVARCIVCNRLFKENLTWTSDEMSTQDADYTSPLIQLIGAHHWDYPKGSDHGHVALFTNETDAQKEPINNTNEEAMLIDLFPDAVGTLTVSRTSSRTVFNTIVYFTQRFKKQFAK